MTGVGIGAAHQPQGGHVMGGHHPRVGGVELVAVALRLQEVLDLRDPLRHHQQRSRLFLGQKVAHGAVEAAGHPHRLFAAGEQRKGAPNLRQPVRVPVEQDLPGPLDVHVEEPLRFGLHQIDDAMNRSVQDLLLTLAMIFLPASRGIIERRADGGREPRSAEPTSSPTP